MSTAKSKALTRVLTREASTRALTSRVGVNESKFDPKKKAAVEKQKMKKVQQAQVATQKKKRMLEELAPKNSIGPFLFENLPPTLLIEERSTLNETTS